MVCVCVFGGCDRIVCLNGFKNAISSSKHQNRHRNAHPIRNRRIYDVDALDLNSMGGSVLTVASNQFRTVDMGDQQLVKPLHIVVTAL